MVATPFTQSIISLKTNAAKNILFRLSTLTLQFAVLKSCAYIAYLKNEYTSFLMFAEGIIQRLLFITSRGMKQSATIVLIFTIAFTSASLYDTLLWGLDSPGYVVRSNVVDGSTSTPNLLPNPSYFSTVNNPSCDPRQINIDEALGSNLFIPGFNFSLTQSDYTPIPQAIIPPPKNISATLNPRIYLDKDGFGLGFNKCPITEETVCPTAVDKSDPQYASWACNLPGIQSNAFLNQPVARPLIWWSATWSTTIPPTPDSPWASLEIGRGVTTAMKQVFTLTRGNQRHTFLQTTFGFSMYGPGIKKIGEDEITTLIQRSLTLFPGNSSRASGYAKDCIDAQTNGANVITRGFMFQNATYPAITLTSVDFINEVISGIGKIAGFLHVGHTNIELFRSENISEPVQPAALCDGDIFNIETAGRISDPLCFPTPKGNKPAGFVGQYDTSATAIITDVLGDGTSDISAVALNQTGVQWYLDNSHRLDQLLLSRAFLVGGNTDSVRITVHHNEAAISHLQLFLIILPFLMAILASVYMSRDEQGYYKKSFFASVAITCIPQPSTRESAGYIINPPTFIVLPLGVGTKDGPISIDNERRLEDKDPYAKDYGGGEEDIELLSATR